MASLTADNAKYATLTGTTVDTVTLTGVFFYVEVLNLSGTASLYFTMAPGATVPATPTVGGDDTKVVPAGTSLTLSLAAGLLDGCVVKIIGDGNAYGVSGVN